MKKTNLKSLAVLIGVSMLFIISFSVINESKAHTCATCSSTGKCKACSTCEYCKHCSKDKGTCSVCK